MGARLAQECVRITGADFRSMIFPTQYHIPSYARWLLHEADMAPAYRWHRRMLQVLQSRHPAQRWVLKSPSYLAKLPKFFAHIYAPADESSTTKMSEFSVPEPP
jgi:hypothetical protein